jgi:hypothetical protein
MTEVVDPQSLFQQFSPSLYFDSPKASSKADWYILIEQSVPVAEEEFWKTVVSTKRKATRDKYKHPAYFNRKDGLLNHNMQYHLLKGLKSNPVNARITQQKSLFANFSLSAN